MQNPHQKTPATVTNGRSIAQHANGTGVSLPAPAPLQLKGETPGIQEDEMIAVTGASAVQRFTLPNEQNAASRSSDYSTLPPPWRAREPSAGTAPSQPLQRFTLQMQLPGPGTASGKVVQLTSAQVRLKEGKIAGVIIRGRPPRIFSDSMGDHTTAFIIQTEGINIALQNATLTEAVAYMSELVIHLEGLPGLEYIKEGSPIAKGFSRELNTLKTSLVAAKNAVEADDESLAISHLQQVISAYLDARELVPFSTLNVGAKSKGTAGRGHGESRPAKTLSAFERGETVEKEDLLEAVYKLFDERSAGMVSVENNSNDFDSLTGNGVDKSKLEGVKIIDRIWEQHKQSIHQLFPKVYAEVEDELEEGDFDENLEKIRKSNIRNLISDALNAVKRVRDMTANMVTNFSSKLPIARGRINISYLKAISRLYAEQRNVMELMEEIYQLNEELENGFAGDLEELHEEIDDTQKKVLEKVPEYQPDHARMNKVINNALEQYTGQEKAEGAIKGNARDVFTGIQDYKGNSPFSRFEKRKIKPQEEEEDTSDGDNLSEEAEKRKRKTPAPDAPTLTSRLSPMAIQISVDADGIIREMLSSGRPPSPFRQTMGAHTTAWAVHLDRIRTRITGQHIPGAARKLLTMTDEVIAFAEERKHMTKGNNVTNVLPAAAKNIGKNKKVDPDTANLSTIQEMISAILTYFNLVPGVSVNKIDTTGHGEGKSRGILLRYEKYEEGVSKDTIRSAIKGLKDGGNNKLHKKYIAEAYPKSWEYLNNGKMPDKMDQEIEDENLDKLSEEVEPDIDTPTGLNESEKQELTGKKADISWLTHVNNCLINAITDAAGVPRANADTIITIRERLGVPVAEMLAASTHNLDVILHELHLNGTGVVVVYQGEIYVDESSGAGDNPLFIYHDGINHFTPLYDARRRKNKEKETTVSGKPKETEDVSARALTEEEEENPSSSGVDLFASGNHVKRKRSASTERKEEKTGSDTRVNKKAKTGELSQENEEEEEATVTGSSAMKDVEDLDVEEEEDTSIAGKMNTEGGL